MNLLITNYINDVNKTELKKEYKKGGNFYSQDRYFTWLNSQIDYRLRHNNKLLYLLVSFLMRSTNYRHDSSVMVKKPFWAIFIDVICWIAMIGFLVCLFLGIATPMIKAIKETINLKSDYDKITQAWRDAFGSGQTIVAIVFTVITLTIGIIYLYIITKVIPKNKTLNIKDYVCKKIDYVVKFGIAVKTEDLINKNLNSTKEKLKIKKNKIEQIIFDKAEILNDTDRWIILQITNILYKIFANFSVVLEFSNISKETYDQLKEIVENDFLFTKLVVLDENKKEKTM